MNTQQIKNTKTPPPVIDDLEFDFRPITPGLGFHHQNRNEVRPQLAERKVAASSSIPVVAKKEMNIYQNDLSLFYGPQAKPQAVEVSTPAQKEEKSYPVASRRQRIMAYFLDLIFLGSILSLVLTIMARTISLDLREAWFLYPNEMTPLVVTLFVGFYLIYFSIFEKSANSTIGKDVLGLRVVDEHNRSLSLTYLFFRAFIGLLNFVSLGLFSYFDLQNKVTGSKIIKVN
jgi:uncharacterized RDD family membrane protein YckC